ncbi:MAG: acyltransferase [Demequinaceae bacterium]|nr:acyltransferase [Demequinaceae bacterium]
MTSATSSEVISPRDEAASKRSQKQISRLTGAEGLRALACLNILFFHAVIRIDPATQDGWFRDVQDFFSTGAVGVAVFFVLSGMLLSYRFWMAFFTKTSYPSIGHFIRRRVSRILPGFYFVLVVSFLIDRSNANAWNSELYEPVRRLIGGFTLTSSFHYETYFPVDSNIPLWAVPMEAVCYVVLPLAMWVLFSIRRRGTQIGIGFWLSVIAIGVLINGWVVSTFQMDGRGEYWSIDLARDQIPGRNPAAYFGQFAIGVLAAAAIVLWKIHRKGKRTWWFDATGLVIAVGMVVFFWVIRGDWSHQASLTMQEQPYYYPYYAVLLGILAVALGFSRWLWRLFEIAPLRFIAKYSYGIYLWHSLVFDWYAREIDWRYGWYADTDHVHFIYGTLVCLALTIVVSMISWHVIERPFVEGWLSGQKKARASTPS